MTSMRRVTNPAMLSGTCTVRIDALLRASLMSSQFGKVHGVVLLAHCNKELFYCIIVEYVQHGRWLDIIETGHSLGTVEPMSHLSRARMVSMVSASRRKSNSCCSCAASSSTADTRSKRISVACQQTEGVHVGIQAGLRVTTSS